jgi:hypothetical protein
MHCRVVLSAKATFVHIRAKTLESAANGVISSDVWMRRHRRNGVNIRVTFCSVVLQVAML